MTRARMPLRLACALALAFSWPTSAFADGPLDLPPAAGIAPGDILVLDFFNDWIKFDPDSDQLFSLPWDDRAVGPFVFDLDGSILLVDSSSSGRSLARLHPVTGVATNFGPSLPRISDLEILPNGDLLLAKPATSLSVNGDVWTGGFDGGLLRYSRQTGLVTPLPKPLQFSPHRITLGPAGETYILEHFRGLQRVDLTSGSLTEVGGAESDLFWASNLEVFPDGDIAHDKFDGIYRLDPDTGAETLFAAGPPFNVRLAIDEVGNAWTGNRNGLYFIDVATGQRTLRYPGASFFSPDAMVVVPSDWTPPPVPEPASWALSSLAFLAAAYCRRSKKRV